MDDIRKPSIQHRQSNFKERVVEDFSIDEDFIKRAQQADAEDLKRQETPVPSISEGAKKRIEALCGLTRITKDINIDGSIFTIRTLKAREIRDIVVEVSKHEGSVDVLFQSRRNLLSRSICKINNIDIDLFLSDSSIEAKLNFVDELEDVVLAKILNEYNLMVSDLNKKLNIGTEEGVKEVVEQIKK